MRYNVKVEQEMTPEEVAEKLFPVDEAIREVAKAVFEGDEDEVVESLQNAIDKGKDPISLINDALIVGMDIVSTRSSRPGTSKQRSKPCRPTSPDGHGSVGGATLGLSEHHLRSSQGDAGCDQHPHAGRTPGGRLF